MKAFIVFILLIAVHSIESRADEFGNKYVGDWEYTTIMNDNGFYTAMTSSTKYSNVVLMFGCSDTVETPDLRLFGVNTTTDEGLFLPSLKRIRYQIDNQPVETADVTVASDGHFAVLEAKNLLKNIAYGNKIKFEWIEKDRTIFPVFSLKGSYKAIFNTYKQCEASEETGFSTSHDVGFTNTMSY